MLTTQPEKIKDEASMLLNHKEALDFILDHPDYVAPLKASGIEDVSFPFFRTI